MQLGNPIEPKPYMLCHLCTTLRPDPKLNFIEFFFDILGKDPLNSRVPAPYGLLLDYHIKGLKRGSIKLYSGNKPLGIEGGSSLLAGRFSCDCKEAIRALAASDEQIL